MDSRAIDRRSLVLVGAISGLGALASACGEKPSARSAGDAKADDAKDEDVSPPEDLMREHGALNRILLVYEECVRRLEIAGPPPSDALTQAATIVRRFIEDYHEKLEEDF